MRKLLVLIIILCSNPTAYAKPINTHSTLIGQGSLHYFLWHIYDVRLYAEEGFSFDRPFSLTLEYKRDLVGEKIADRSAEEIRKLGFTDEITLAAWHAQMRNIFPDVSDGMRLTGVYTPNQATYFYRNDTEIGMIADPAFGRWFFGIWLNENTSEPQLRRALLGEK